MVASSAGVDSIACGPVAADTNPGEASSSQNHQHVSRHNHHGQHRHHVPERHDHERLPTWARHAVDAGLLVEAPPKEVESVDVKQAGVSLAWLRRFAGLLEKHTDLDVHTENIVHGVIMPAVRHRKTRCVRMATMGITGSRLMTYECCMCAYTWDAPSHSNN